MSVLLLSMSRTDEGSVFVNVYPWCLAHRRLDVGQIAKQDAQFNCRIWPKDYLIGKVGHGWQTPRLTKAAGVAGVWRVLPDGYQLSLYLLAMVIMERPLPIPSDVFGYRAFTF